MNQGGFRYLQSLRRGDQIGSFPARWQRCGIQPGEVKLRASQCDGGGASAAFCSTACTLGGVATRAGVTSGVLG